MVFITILLGIVAYIFAIVGVIFFESYTLSGRDDLLFPQSFRSVSPHKLNYRVLSHNYIIHRIILKTSCQLNSDSMFM